MKKLFILMGLLALVAVNFTSCSKDDDDKEDKKTDTIIGVWKSDKIYLDYEAKGRVRSVVAQDMKKEAGKQYVMSYWVYTKEGIEYEVSARFDANDKFVTSCVFIGTYTMDGNHINEVFGHRDTYVDYDYTIEDDVLTLTGDDKKYGHWVNKYQRASENEMKKYYNVINPQKKLVGTWKRTGGPFKNQNHNVYYDQYQVKEKGGAIHNILVYYNFNDQSEWVEIAEGKWSFDHFMLNEHFNNGEEYTCLVGLGEDFFDKTILMDGGNYYTLHYVPIDKSEIQKYLDNPDHVFAPARR